MDTGPENSQGVLFWLVVVALALWGSTAAYIERMRRLDDTFSWLGLVGDWVISGFVGVMVAYACLHVGFSWEITAALCGIAGHQGSRAMALLVRWARARTGQ